MDSKIIAPLGDGIEPYYTCQRCRHELFKQSDLDGHEPNAQKISRRKVSIRILSFKTLTHHVSHDNSSVGSYESTHKSNHTPTLWLYGYQRLGGVLQTSASVCTSHFIREGACQSLEWLGPMTEVEGKLHCPTPGCGSRIGNYSWTGSQCSCKGQMLAPRYSGAIGQRILQLCHADCFGWLLADWTEQVGHGWYLPFRCL
jgi:hypothetical protein